MSVEPHIENWSDNISRDTLHAMQSPHRKQVRHYDEPGHVHELTFSCYRWLPLFSDDLHRRLYCEACGRAVLRHHYRLFAFIVMPEHVHLIVQPKADGSPVKSLLAAIKRPCSFRIKDYLKTIDNPLLKRLTIRQRPGVMTFRFWQEGPGYDRNLTQPKTILSAIDYVHENPVRRKLCERAVDWHWSSARSYLSGEPDPDLPVIDPLPLDLLDEGTT